MAAMAPHGLRQVRWSAQFLQGMRKATGCVVARTSAPLNNGKSCENIGGTVKNHCLYMCVHKNEVKIFDSTVIEANGISAQATFAFVNILSIAA